MRRDSALKAIVKMSINTSNQDKGQLISKITYVYFCFFSMLVSEKFSMSLIYGATIFISLSALFRMFMFTIKTMADSIWRKAIKAVLITFFLIATLYTIILNPLLFPRANALFAIAIITMPFISSALENAFLRQRSSTGSLTKKAIAWIVLPIHFLALLAVALLALPSGLVGTLVCSASMAIGQTLRFVCQYTFRRYEIEYSEDKQQHKLHKIHSVRLYDGMAITSEAALNIFAFTYILYILLSGSLNFLIDFFVVFNVIAMIFSIVYISKNRFMRTEWMSKLGKNTAFLIGTTCAILALFVFSDSWHSNRFVISIQTVLLLFGLTLQMTATQGMSEDISLVARLYDDRVSDDIVRHRTLRLSMWASVISETVFLAVLLFLISNPVYHHIDLTEYIEYAPYIGSIVAIIPTFFLIVSLVYSIKQPLTRKFSSRLRKYFGLQEKGKDNPYMKKRLISKLIENTKKAVGVQIIRAFLKPIMYHSVEGKENVTDIPGVFVFNHREIYGPIAAVVFLPYDIRPWILNKMIDKTKIYDHIYEGTFSIIKWLPPFMRKGIPKILSPIICWALSSFDPIPVYRGSTRDIIKTFTLSVECLCSGDSILLFPENPTDRYTVEVSSFYKGFANIGKMYHRKTGESLMFYPVYASSKRRLLSIGKGVKYDPNGGKQERDRIVDALEQRMKALQELDDK